MRGLGSAFEAFWVMYSNNVMVILLDFPGAFLAASIR